MFIMKLHCFPRAQGEAWGKRGGSGLEESRTCGMVSRVNWVETVLALTSRGYFWQERPQGLYCGQVCGTQVCPEVQP